MKYKQIIQELKESEDPNVLVFLKDLEKHRKLPRREKKEMLTRIQEPGVIDALVKNYIPTIVRVAYTNSLLTRTMSFLDLVNEGVIAAHKCMIKYKKEGKVSDRAVTATIVGTLKKKICRKECPFTVCRFNENDPRLYMDVNKMWFSYNKKEKIPELMKEKIKWTRNTYGIRVRQCCASCAHKDLTRAVSRRFCMVSEKYVEPHHVCDSWQMSEQMKKAGLVHIKNN